MSSAVTAFSQALGSGWNGKSENAPLDIVSVETKSIILKDDWMPSPADMSRRAKMQAAIKAYAGDLQKPLRKGRDGVDDNIMENLIGPIVRALRSMLFGKSLQMTVDEAAGQQVKKSSQAWCDAFAKANSFSVWCKELKQNGALCGSAFWKLVEHKPYPRLVLIDPTQMSVVTDPCDWSVVIAYVQDYQMIEPTTGDLVDHRHIEYRENADSQTWIIVDKERNAGQKYWGPDSTTQWPYAWSPIHACKNLPSACEWWGEPDVTEDLIGLNNGLNFIQSNTARILKFHATPHTQLRGGASAKNIDFGPENVIGNLGPNGYLENLEMASDLGSSLAFANILREGMSMISSIPPIALASSEAMPKGALSGVAIAMYYQPALNRTEDARELYGPALESTFSHALELCNMGSEIEIHATWQEVLPRDEQADWTVVQQQIEAGVSIHQIMEDHHLDYDEQMEWRQQEAEDKAALSAANPSPLTMFNRGQNLPPMPPTSRGQQQLQPPASDNGQADAESEYAS